MLDISPLLPGDANTTSRSTPGSLETTSHWRAAGNLSISRLIFIFYAHDDDDDDDDDVDDDNDDDNDVDVDVVVDDDDDDGDADANDYDDDTDFKFPADGLHSRIRHLFYTF